MKIKQIALAAALAASFASTAAFAQTEARNELGGQLMIGTTKTDAPGSSSADFGFGNLFYGRFVTSQLEVLGNVNYSVAGSGSFQTTTIGVGAGVSYYFTSVGKKGNVAPYIGVDVGVSNTDAGATSFNSFVYDGKVGLKMFFTDNAALSIEYMHRVSEDDSAFSVKTTDDFVTLGVSTLF